MTTLATPTKMTTNKGNLKNATIAVTMAAKVSALLVIKTVGAITAIKTAGGTASKAAFNRPCTTTPRINKRPESRVE